MRPSLLQLDWFTTADGNRFDVDRDQCDPDGRVRITRLGPDGVDTAWVLPDALHQLVMGAETLAVVRPDGDGDVWLAAQVRSARGTVQRTGGHDDGPDLSAGGEIRPR